MLSTINGFDLLLIITIVVMGFRIYNLNRECESYVGQILKISWAGRSQEKDQSLFNPNCKDCYGWEEYCGFDTHVIDAPFKSDYGYCDFCTEAKPVELYPRCTCDDF
jgi:hypothetical protein